MKFTRVAGTFGALFRVFSLFLLIPLLGSLYWDAGVPATSHFLGFELGLKPTTVSFGLTFLVVLLLGFLLKSLGRVPEELRERESLFIVGAGWIYCALLGAIPFLLTKATHDPTVAVYESMSAITTTGYSALAGRMESYPESLHLWRGSLHLFGGMGIVLVAVVVIGRLTEGAQKLMGGEAGGDVERLRPRLSQTARTLFSIYVALNALAFLGLLLALHYSGDRLAWKASSYHALVHSMGSIATGGMSTRTESVAAFHSPLVASVVFLAMFAGGVSFPLYYRALVHGPAVFWRSGEFRFYLSVLVLAFLAVAGFLLADGAGFGFAVGHGSFQVLTSLVTCGYATLDVNRFPEAAKLVLVFLMFTGAMVGSTTGALKLGRIQLLLRLTYTEVVHLLHPRAVGAVKFGGRIFPEESIRRVVVFFFSYVSVFIAGALLLSLFGFGFGDAIVASASSLGGVGLGWGASAGFADPVSEAARVVGILLMWMGRLEIFTALLIFIPATYRD